MDQEEPASHQEVELDGCAEWAGDVGDWITRCRSSDAEVRVACFAVWFTDQGIDAAVEWRWAIDLAARAEAIVEVAEAELARPNECCQPIGLIITLRRGEDGDGWLCPMSS
jgi:hypothetical protein